MSEEIVKFFLTFRNTMKMYHWNTNSHPRHKASDALIGKIDDLTDRFVEVYMGRYSRANPNGSKNMKHVALSLPYLPEAKVVDYLHSARDWMSNDLTEMLKKSDTDLLNIRDEILAEINQTLYLFTLK